MLTHLVHFHTIGASPAVAALDTFESGWAQGHFLAGYLGAGAGAGAGPALDNFESGWAQGSLFAYYYGSGADGQQDVVVIPPDVGGGGSVGMGAPARGYWRDRGYNAQRDINRTDEITIDQLLVEDEELLLMIAAAVQKRLI